MARADFKKRLEILKRLYAPFQEEKINFRIAVVHVVDESDPLCGTWMEEEGLPTSNMGPLFIMPPIHYYGRSIAHIDELSALHKAQTENNLGEIK